MRQALGRFPESILSAPPSGQATQPLLAAQPAQYGPKVPMQPALSLVDWTDVPAPVLEPPLADQEVSLLFGAESAYTYSAPAFWF